jgi:hypothetical protein
LGKKVSNIDATEKWMRETCARIAKAARGLAELYEARGNTKAANDWRKTAQLHEERANG